MQLLHEQDNPNGRFHYRRVLQKHGQINDRLWRIVIGGNGTYLYRLCIKSVLIASHSILRGRVLIFNYFSVHITMKPWRYNEISIRR